jgi:quinol monooxygenase YgiN
LYVALLEELPMRQYFVAAAVMVAAVLAHNDAASAQDAAQPIYLITYIEVAPDSASEARQLILAHSVDARKAPGAMQVDALQRIDYPNQFALVEQWQSQAARQAYVSTDPVTKFRAALGPLQSAGYDERLHAPLSVGPSKPAPADPVMMITHVDVVPTATEAGTAKVVSIAEQGRSAAGNRRFDALVQANRKNHMTIVESWDAMADKNAWISTPAARSFRQELHPMSGALYDERAYRLIR